MTSATGYVTPAAKCREVESLNDYLIALASDAPTPGGGSAATVVAAAGAALVAMVARIDAANPKYAQHRTAADELVREADALREQLLQARTRDEAAFGHVVAAQALPKSTLAEQSTRHEALEIALTHAAAEPLANAAICLAVLRLTARALAIPNRNLASDLGCAASFAHAGLTACAYNVRVNHRFMRNAKSIDEQARKLAELEVAGNKLESDIRTGVMELLHRVDS